MIHYSCDRCKRIIDPAQDVRHVVRIDVQTVLDAPEKGELEDDRDYLDEVDEALQATEWDDDGPLPGETPETLRYDLCTECLRKYIRDPLGVELPLHVGFSHN
jgi:hypothetical protein